MIGISAAIYNSEYDGDKKDPKWGDMCCTNLRRNWRRMVGVARGIDDRRLMFSMQPLDYVRNSFQDTEFITNTQFLPLPILESLVNTVVDEIRKAPPKIEVKATNPAAINEKENDIQLLKNRQIAEKDISGVNAQVKQPPFKIGGDRYNSNVQDFDKMGLDENDSDDVNFFSDSYHRLWYEIGAQSLIDNIVKYNEFDEITLRKLVKDIFSYKSCAAQAYVDRITGAIKWRYLDPEICRGVFGQTNDGKDDVCRGWEQNVTLMEFLERVGNEFNWQRDWRYLLWAINQCNSTRFTGFVRDSIQFDCCGNAEWEIQGGMVGWESSLLDWSLAYTYKVSMGYIEWQTPEATATYLKKYKDEKFIEPVQYSYELKKKKQVKEYYKESFYQQQWYCTYFLATTSVSQWIFDFQKVYFQTLEGFNDEYSNGTLKYWQEEGLSAVEIAKPYIREANLEFYRRLWLIYKAKPDVDEFQYEELIELSKAFKREFGQQAANGAMPSMENVLNQIIQYQRKNHVRIRMYPRIDGRPVPTVMPIEKRGTGGIDATATMMQAAITWAEMNIAAKIGINPMRLGMNPPPRESNKTEQDIVGASYNSTGYMYFMVYNVKRTLCIASMNYAQDILKYKDSIPYNWILNMVGTELFESLKSLGNLTAHRMGIFVGDYSTSLDKQQILAAANAALSQKEISYSQWFVITQTQDYKMAAKQIDFFKRRQEKKVRQHQIQDMQMQHQNKMEEMAAEKDLEVTKGQLVIEGKRLDAQAIILSAQIQAKAKTDTTMMKNEAEPEKIGLKTESAKDLEQMKSNLQGQQSMPAA